MTTTDYRKKMENELIRQFVNTFYEKIGYRPIVITEKNIGENGLIVLTLNELEEYFTPYLPTIFGKKVKLGAKNRKRSIVELRCIFFFIAKSMKYTLTSIGAYLRRDHTTVLHNIVTFKNLYETDEKFKMKYINIINNIIKDHEPSTLEHINKMEYKS